MVYLAFVCLSVCLLATLRENYWLDLRENFTRDDIKFVQFLCSKSWTFSLLVICQVLFGPPLQNWRIPSWETTVHLAKEYHEWCELFDIAAWGRRFGLRIDSVEGCWLHTELYSRSDARCWVWIGRSCLMLSFSCFTWLWFLKLDNWKLYCRYFFTCQLFFVCGILLLICNVF